MWVETDVSSGIAVGMSIPFEKGFVKTFNQEFKSEVLLSRFTKASSAVSFPKNVFILFRININKFGNGYFVDFKDTDEAEKYLLIVKEKAYARHLLFQEMKKKEAERAKCRFNGGYAYRLSVNLE